MDRAECRRLIDAYLQWLREELQITEREGVCEISTPFLDRHNDAITIYVEQKNGAVRLTDDGETIRDLRAGGMEFGAPRRRAHLQSVLNGFGVRLEGDELAAIAAMSDFPRKKHDLVQAILSVNDMFVMAEKHVLSLFKEDVALFLESHEIAVFSDFKLSGKSGLDHTFDFGLPRTPQRPQRVLRAINYLTKDNAMSLAFAVSDVRAIRTDPLGAYAMINDAERAPNEEQVQALRAYEVEPLLWSRRRDAVPLLNGHP
jgi:hypothetical protein